MKYFSPFLLLVFIAILISCKQAPTSEEVIARLNEKIQQIESMEFNVVRRFKAFQWEDRVDTLSYTYWIVKDPTDSLFGYKWRIKEHGKREGREHIYTLEDLYFILHNHRKAYIDKPEKSEASGSYSTTTAKMSILKEFVHGIDYEALIADSVQINLLSDTTLPNHWLLELHYPDRSDFYDGITRKFWINKTTWMSEKMALEEKAAPDLHQYNIISVSNFKINPPYIADSISELIIPEDYELQYLKPPKKKIYTILQKGMTAPDFTLYDVQGNLVKLSDLRGNMVLLDFWYIFCPPCVKAIPHLQRLHEKYSKKSLVVLGLNAKDNKEKRKEKIIPFLKSKNITYTNLLATSKIDSSYNVRGYPTLYVIDKNGNILYGHRGYSEYLMDSLEQVIVPLLE